MIIMEGFCTQQEYLATQIHPAPMMLPQESQESVVGLVVLGSFAQVHLHVHPKYIIIKH